MAVENFGGILTGSAAYVGSGPVLVLLAAAFQPAGRAAAGWPGRTVRRPLAATTLLGLVLFAAFGWWWADPIAALAVAWFAVREGREAWRGELACDDD